MSEQVSEQDLELVDRLPAIKDFLIQRITADVKRLRDIGMSEEDIADAIDYGPKRGRPSGSRTRKKSVEQTAA